MILVFPCGFRVSLMGINEGFRAMIFQWAVRSVQVLLDTLPQMRAPYRGLLLEALEISAVDMVLRLSNTEVYSASEERRQKVDSPR
jgi:hypothetical protein